MKKLAAICMVTLHLVNITGGRLFLEYLIQQSDTEMNRRIDLGQYAKEELQEMKLPLNLAYYSSSMEYERYYGEIELDGRFLNYVMRKVINDTVYLLCISNEEKKELHDSKTGIALTASGIEGMEKPGKGVSHPLKKQHAAKEYFQEKMCFDFPQISPDKTKLDNTFVSPLVCSCRTLPERPPETALSVMRVRIITA